MDRGAAVARCPVVPLRLVVAAPGLGSTPVLTLDARGDLRARPELSGAGAKKVVARLDSRGCLTGPDGVWVEVLPDGDLWTLREVIDVESDLLRRSPARTLRIARDGTVETLAPAGGVEHNPYGSLRFEGYRDEGRCAAQVLLAAFIGMMPSMAVVDGSPVRMPRPKGSVCGGS